MSFLTQGRWSRPVRALGFDPVVVVQRAIVTGALRLPAPAPRRPKQDRQQRQAVIRRCMAALRARRVAEGLTARGEPRKNRWRPELAGLKGKAYHAAYTRLWRRERRGQP